MDIKPAVSSSVDIKPHLPKIWEFIIYVMKFYSDLKHNYIVSSPKQIPPLQSFKKPLRN